MASVDLFGLLSAYDWCVLDSRRYAALSLCRVYLHNSNNRNKCWLFPVRFRFSMKKNIHLNSLLLHKYQFYLKKLTLIVQARGHRRQQLTIIKILIYLDETNKYINLGMMISLKKMNKRSHVTVIKCFIIKFYQYHWNL